MTAPIVLHTNHSILAHPVGVETPANGDGLARSRAYLNTHNGMGEHVAPEGHDPRTVAPGAIGGNRVAGQLWGRVAETTLNAEALAPAQWARMASRRNELGTRRPAAGMVRMPEPLAANHAEGWVSKFASGHIRGNLTTY